MINLKDALTSSIGKKILNGLTAIGLVLFVIVHLGGNLTLIAGREAFNSYAAKLHALGPLLYVLEFGLLAVIILHIVTSIWVTTDSADARSGVGYKGNHTSKGGPSSWGISSHYMIVSGLGLLVFLIIHLAQFRLSEYIWGNPDGIPYHKQLYGMVDHAFADPVWVVVYTVAMLLLGLHLRHGIWSMFQSIGAMNERWKATATTIALILGIALAVGFLILPVGMYLDVVPLVGEAAEASSGAGPGH